MTIIIIISYTQSPDGSRIALSLETGQIYIFDLSSSSLQSTYTAHATTVRSLAWSADSSLLLSASDDRRLTLFDVRVRGAGGTGSGGGGAGGAVATLVGHGSWVLSTAFSPDGRLALSGYVLCSSLLLYLIPLMNLPYVILYYRSADKTIKVWDIGTRAAVSTLPVPDTGEVWSVAWNPNPSSAVIAGGGEFVTGGEDGVVRWWRSAGSG